MTKQENTKFDKQLNKGFTLVELIVSIAVLAIVGVAIFSFLLVSLNLYKNNTSEVNVQTESQLTWKRLEANILSATNGISTSDNEINLYNYVNNEDPNLRYQKTRIYYDSTDNTLYYQEYVNSDNGWVESGEKQLFSKSVESFDIKLFDSENNEIEIDDSSVIRPVKVEAHINYKVGNKEYDSKNTVAIRNNIVASNNFKIIYENY